MRAGVWGAQPLLQLDRRTHFRLIPGLKPSSLRVWSDRPLISATPVGVKAEAAEAAGVAASVFTGLSAEKKPEEEEGGAPKSAATKHFQGMLGKLKSMKTQNE